MRHNMRVRKPLLGLPLWTRLLLVGVLLCMSEVFGRRSREDQERDELADLRDFATAAGESFSLQRPADAGSEASILVLDFDRVCRELESLGFDCDEVTRGIDKELGLGHSLDHPTEVIVGHFVRRQGGAI